MLYQVKDNKITLRSVPHTYTHDDGSQTVGYNLLSPEELAQDGWIEVVEVKPEYDEDTHYLEYSEEIKAGIPWVIWIPTIKPVVKQNVSEQQKVWDTLQYLLGVESPIAPKTE